ncbi:uncharacterized protein LTR77_009625 [Saxophila tyrrhenica]|uniref:EKC/KEOPS complex subunit BUD32 n=1 Tax=Saxophila tyrrhenica TaxID=1690608 RepID=A0AAV9NYW8_9PEZI|nr:hypothetical protein LTR77_009625 [Saxophila tyrrhenica]
MDPPGRLYYPTLSDTIEDIEKYRPGGFHPVHLGDTFHGKYKVLHKLGAGGFSTTWLARDAVEERYVALKILRSDETARRNELDMLRRLAELQTNHPGKKHIRTLVDHFSIHGPNGEHICLVTEVAGPSLRDVYSAQNPSGCGYGQGSRRLRADIAQTILNQIAQTVDSLHSHRICHGDLTLSNVLLKLNSMDAWTEDELYHRLGMPVKVPLRLSSGEEHSGSGPLYAVEPAGLPDAAFLENNILLVDFGKAFELDSPPQPKDIGVPSDYRAPETILDLVYTPPSEAWSLACLLYEVRAGQRLFANLLGGPDEIVKQMVEMKGALPEPWWSLWDLRTDYFDESGKPLQEWPDGTTWAIEYPIDEAIDDIGAYDDEEEGAVSGLCASMLEPCGAKVPGTEAENMLELLKAVLRWTPEERVSIKQIYQHP